MERFESLFNQSSSNMIFFQESGLLGSTKYVMANMADIKENLIAYINVDVGVAGTEVDGSASPSLASLVSAAMSQLIDPAKNRTLSSVFDARPFPLGQLQPLGSGSDFTSFWAHIGVPSIDLGFRSEFTGAPYHSAFDDLLWMDRYGSFGGTYAYYVVLARLIGTLAIRLGDERTSLNSSDTSNALLGYVELFEKLVAASNLTGVETERLRDVVQKFSSVVSSTNITALQSVYLDRHMQFAPGLPGRPFFKNLMSAPGRDNGYEAMVYPGPSQAVLDGDVGEANVQIDNLVKVLTAGMNYLKNA
jgi:N-acetylated-alpha-linked acidic dipeptidase